MGDVSLALTDHAARARAFGIGVTFNSGEIALAIWSGLSDADVGEFENNQVPRKDVLACRLAGLCGRVLSQRPAFKVPCTGGARALEASGFFSVGLFDSFPDNPADECRTPSAPVFLV